MKPPAALVAALLLTGSIGITHDPGEARIAILPVEVPFGPLAPGSDVGVDATNASASVAGTVLSTSTGLWWLNNTNASAPYLAKLVLAGSSGLANLVGLTVGVDNGTRTPQVVAALGALTQVEGPYVRLEPGSRNVVYATQSVATPGFASTLRLDVHVADDAQASGLVVTKARLTVA